MGSLQPGKAVQDDGPGRNEVKVEGVSRGLPMPDVRNQASRLIGVPQPLSQRLATRMTANALSVIGRSMRVSSAVACLKGSSEVGVWPREERCGRNLSAPGGGQKEAARGGPYPAKVVLQDVDRRETKAGNRLGNVGVDTIPLPNILVDVNLELDVVFPKVTVPQYLDVGFRQEANLPGARKTIEDTKMRSSLPSQTTKIKEEQTEPIVEARWSRTVKTMSVHPAKFCLLQRAAALSHPPMAATNHPESISKDGRLEWVGERGDGCQRKISQLPPVPVGQRCKSCINRRAGKVEVVDKVGQITK